MKSTQELETTGAFATNPDRKRKNINDERPLGEPPVEASAAFKVVWYEIADYVTPGLLCRADRLTMEILCGMVEEYRNNRENCPIGILKEINVLLGKFGMNPADRRKFNMNEEPKKSAEDEFFN